MIAWLRADEFVPHGFCLSWDPDLMMAVVFANALIALSYFALTVMLGCAARAPRPGIPRWIYWSFAAFILCRGLSHVLDNVTLWLPVYRLQAAVLCATALVSLFAAIFPMTIWITYEASRWRD